MVANGANIDRDASVVTTGQRSPDEPQLAAQWARVRGRLQGEVGDVEYRTWLRQMSLGGLDGDEVTVRLPTRFLRDWVRTHYGDRLNALWQAENRQVRRVDIRVGGIAEGEGLAEPVTVAESPLPPEPPPPTARPAWPGAHRRTCRDRRGARSALHLRQLRGRQAERVRLCLRPPRGRTARQRRASTRCSCMAASGWAKPT